MSYKVEIAKPNFSGKEIEYMNEAILRGEIACKGKNTDEMTRMLTDYVGRKYVQLLSNGTAGLHLAVKAAGVTDKDVVFCPTLTYCGTVYPIIYERAIPCFIDCKEDGTMDKDLLYRAIKENKNKRIKAVIAVDTYGTASDYYGIEEIAKEFNLPLISDSAESLGGTLKGRKCGSFGDISVFSFSYSKVVTSSLGGAAMTDNEEYAQRIKYLANQAKASSKCYIHKEVGYNYLMSNVLAGMGRAQMEILPQNLLRKRQIYEKYKEELSYIPGVTFIADSKESGHWQSGLVLNNNKGEKLCDLLLDCGIEVRCGFNPMHRQEAFSGFEYYTDKDISTKLFYNTVLLPSGVGMTEDEQNLVIEKINECVRKL